MPMRLTKQMKIFIITELACYEKPPLIRDRLKEQFDVEIKLTTIKYYDAETAGTDLSEDWRTMFTSIRAEFNKNVAKVPIMNRAFRARQLQRTLEKEWDRENTVGVRETLKQAAEEEGGAFTNRRELTGPGGAPLPVATLSVTFVDPPTRTSPAGSPNAG